MKTIQAIFKGYNRLTDSLSWIAYVGIVILVLVTCVDVAGRYFFNSPLLGSFEITEVMMAAIGGFAIMWTTTQGGHIIVDIISSKFSKRVQGAVDIISSLLGIAVWGIITYQVFELGKYTLATNEHTNLIRIPLSPFQFILAAGLVMYCVTLFMQIIRRFLPEGLIPERKKEGPVI